jgi:hypothetical protein
MWSQRKYTILSYILGAVFSAALGMSGFTNTTFTAILFVIATISAVCIVRSFVAEVKAESYNYPAFLVKLLSWRRAECVLPAALSAICIVMIAMYITTRAPAPSGVVVAGKLFPANGPTPPNSCDRRSPDEIPKDAALLIAGPSASFMSFAGKVTALQLGNCPMVRVQRAGDGLLIDANVFDASGKLVGYIGDNYYQAVDGNKSYADRRGDLSTLAIVGDSGKELFYIRYINLTTIRIRGTFACQQSQAKEITITDSSIAGSANTRLCILGTGTRVAIQVP